MRGSPLLLLGLLAACGGVPAKPSGEPPAEVAYRAALVSTVDPAVEITLALTGAAAGETTLATAPGWDIDHPERRFLGVTVSDGRGQSLPVIAEPGPRWRVRHPAGERLLVRYDITRDFLARAREGAKESTQSVLEKLTSETTPALGQLMTEVVRDGQTLELPADVLAPCLVLEGAGLARRFRVARAEACPQRL